jgi:hypothetical protein
MNATSKSRLQSGAPQIGIRGQLCGALAAEAIASCDYDTFI